MVTEIVQYAVHTCRTPSCTAISVPKPRRRTRPERNSTLNQNLPISLAQHEEMNRNEHSLSGKPKDETSHQTRLRVCSRQDPT